MGKKRMFLFLTGFIFLFLVFFALGTNNAYASEEKVVNAYYRGIYEQGALRDIKPSRTTANGNNFKVSSNSLGLYFSVDTYITYGGHEYKYLGYMWNTYNPSRFSKGSETIYSGVRSVKYTDIPDGEYGEIIFIYLTKVVNVHYREKIGENSFGMIPRVKDEVEKYRSVGINGSSGTLNAKKVNGYNCIGYIVHYYNGPGLANCMYSSNEIFPGTSMEVYYSAKEMNGNSDWLWAEVIFVYEKPIVPNKIIVEYRDLNTSQLIPGTEIKSFDITSSTTFSANLPSTVQGYEFYGSKKGNGKIQRNKNTVKVEMKDGNLTIIFYYCNRQNTPTPVIVEKLVKVHYVENLSTSNGFIQGKKIADSQEIAQGNVITTSATITYDGDTYQYDGMQVINQLEISTGHFIRQFVEESKEKNSVLLEKDNTKNYEVTFYYHKIQEEPQEETKINEPVEKESIIYCKLEDSERIVPGTPVEGIVVTKQDSPIIPDDTIGEYHYTGKVTVDGTQEKVDCVEITDNESHEIVFWYKKPVPQLIFGVTDPNEDKVTNYLHIRDKVKDKGQATENQIFYPQTMNHQAIHEVANVATWVLEEEGTLVVRFATTRNATHSQFDVTLTFPFSVEYQGRTSKTIQVKQIPVESYSLAETSEYIGYEAMIRGIQIPLTTIEDSYQQKIVGQVTFCCDELGGRLVTGTEKCSLQIVGAVYDFTVTNIDGNTTTGDEKWANSLFANTSEYKVLQLPIGQGIASQMNAKYAYGIKQGTRVYFSLNTKGKKSESITITPKFYYYDKNGNFLGEVTVCNEKGQAINTIRKSSSIDANRMTEEYQSELLKGIQLYGTKIYQNKVNTIGTYQLLQIGKGLRTPYVNYGKDKIQFHETTSLKEQELTYVSHWYADFCVPNRVTYYQNNQRIMQDGFVVVAFSIQTNDETQKEYLAYHLASPFQQGKKQSEWSYERGTNLAFTLPNQKAIANGWQNSIDLSTISKEGFAPVIIYQTDLSTMQNVDSVGTH